MTGHFPEAKRFCLRFEVLRSGAERRIESNGCTGACAAETKTLVRSSRYIVCRARRILSCSFAGALHCTC